MEIEIYIDLSQTKPKDYPLVEKRLRDWHAEGAEIRYNKTCFGQLTVIEAPGRYQVDLGLVDPISAIRELHASLYRYGAKVYIHFAP
jgi:hypothetical protein